MLEGHEPRNQVAVRTQRCERTQPKGYRGGDALGRRDHQQDRSTTIPNLHPGIVQQLLQDIVCSDRQQNPPNHRG